MQKIPWLCLLNRFIFRTHPLLCSVLISFPNVRTLAHAPTKYSAQAYESKKQTEPKKKKERNAASEVCLSVFTVS